MRKRIYLFCLVVTSLVACNQQKTETNTPATPASPALTTPSVERPTNVRKTLESPAFEQNKPLTAHAIQFYTNMLWHYEAAVVINDTEKGKIYEGKWVKFNPDNTLETAFYDGAITKGKWTINEEKNILTILEEGERPTFSQWRVQGSSSSDAIMILVGTKKYVNNATQIKMMRYNNIPVKPVQ